MTTPPKIVLSVSRRTDIPAFYMDWFMNGMERGGFDVRNPFNCRVRHVAATPDTVHTLVFWSKNFGPFLDGGYGEILRGMGFNLFFNFTINTESTILEPHVPPLSQRLDQLSALTRSYGPESVSWRFDPICRYEAAPGDRRDNLGDFNRIAARAAQCGVTRCITSFMDLYAKIKKRTAGIPGFSFQPIQPDARQRLVMDLNARLRAHNIHLFTCCERELQDALPPDAGIVPSACIPNDLFVRLFGGRLSMRRDTGQRVAAGCGCKTAVDIGDYDHHPCFHNCLYCYAHPVPPDEPRDHGRPDSGRGKK